MSGSKMETDREMNEEDLKLQSKSLEDVPSCSSSILDVPDVGDGGDDYYVDDDFKDGINVTLSSVPPPIQSSTNTLEQRQVCSYEERKSKKLSGAGQKRFKKFLNSGHSREEALHLAQNPHKSSDLHKRPRNMDLNGSNSSGNPTPLKIPRQAREAQKPVPTRSVQQRIANIRSEQTGQSKEIGNKIHPSYKEVVAGVKLGILPNGYPNIELSTQQLKAIQNAILTRVENQRKETLKPKFGHCVFKSGYLVIFCKNLETANWLKAIVPMLKPWAGAELSAVDEKDIPRPEILIGFFPWSAEDSSERILALLESQNDGLVVDAWRILQRNTVNQHAELIFTVDGISMNSINKCKFVLDYKFGNAHIRKKFHKKNTNSDH